MLTKKIFKSILNVKHTAIDDIKITVVINHDTGKVIRAHEGHGKTIFTKFFKLLSKEQLANIQLVSGDGAKYRQHD